MSLPRGAMVGSVPLPDHTNLLGVFVVAFFFLITWLAKSVQYIPLVYLDMCASSVHVSHTRDVLMGGSRGGGGRGSGPPPP